MSRVDQHGLSVRWLVPTSYRDPEFPDGLVRETGHRAAKVIDWSYYACPQEITPTTYLPAAPFHEELKACIRKRSRVSGNVRRPFATFDGARAPLSVRLLRFPSGALTLKIRTGVFSIPFSPARMLTCTALPTSSQSQVHWAIGKILAVLSQRDVRARETAVGATSYYPIVRVEGLAAESTDALPWPDLAMIGTRHRDIRAKDTEFISRYRSKNLAFREGEALVVDKQSTLLVGRDDLREQETLEDCVAIALEMRRLLEESVRDAPRSAPLEARSALARRVIESAARPRLVTESHSMSDVWPRILAETQCLWWAQQLLEARPAKLDSPPQPAKSSGATEGPGADDAPSLDRLVARMLELEAQVGSLRVSVLTMTELLRTDYASALNCARRQLEELVASALRRSGKANFKASGDENWLKAQIDALKKDGRVSDDVALYMDFVRSSGNLGSHANKTLANESEAAFATVLFALEQVLEWYVGRFLPQFRCPACRHLQEGGRKFCAECGTSLTPTDSGRCDCGAETGKDAKFCAECGRQARPN